MKYLASFKEKNWCCFNSFCLFLYNLSFHSNGRIDCIQMHREWNGQISQLGEEIQIKTRYILLNYCFNNELNCVLQGGGYLPLEP